MQRGQCFRCGFGKNEHDKREQHGAECNGRFAAELEREHGDQRGGGKIDEVVAEQNQPDQSIGPSKEFFSESRAAMALARFMPQLVAIQAHESRFRAREKRGKQQEQDQQADKAG